MTKWMKRLMAFALCIAFCAPVAGITATSGLFQFDAIEKIMYLPLDGTAVHTYEVTYKGSSATTVSVLVRDCVEKIEYDGGSFLVQPGEKFRVATQAFGTWTRRDKPRQFIMTLTDASGKKGTVEFYQTMVKGDTGDVIMQEEPVWYPNNTVSSVGPHFRDMQNPVTDKWYTFSAVDLSKQGTQTFELVAGNMYVIGEVYVSVQGDFVTVTYHNYYDGKGGNTDNKSEFFTIFRDLESVLDVTPEKIGTPYQFGRSFSITEMLEGDTNVLLFVRNEATFRTYPTASAKFRRFWENTQEYKEQREEMLRIMD